MITTQACDCCQGPLDTEAVRMERVEGAVVFLSHQRWSIVPRGAGLTLCTLCPACGDFISRAIEHLRAHRHPGYAAAEDGPDEATEALRAAS